MVIYFFRHGIAAAKDDPAFPDDVSRPLTSEGVKKTREAADGLKKLGIPIEALLTSPWVRAMETAEILADTLDVRDRLEEMDELAGDRTADEAIAALGRRRHRESIMIVGHQPLLGEIAAKLLTHSTGMQMDLKKSGVCVIDVERIPPKSPGTLLWMMTQKQLRMLR